MFWQSVGAGLAGLADWHVQAGILGAALASALFLVPAILVMPGDQDSGALAGARTGCGCVLALLGAPLCQAAAVTGFLLLCLPAVLGTGGFTPAAAIASLAWPVFKVGFWAFLLVLVLCIVPGLGKLITSTPGVPVFLQGIFILKPILRDLYPIFADGAHLPDSVFPTFLHCAGYVTIGLVLSVTAFFALFLIREKMRERTDPLGLLLEQTQQRPTPSPREQLIAMFLGPLLGVIPLLMYGRYVSLALASMGR